MTSQTQRRPTTAERRTARQMAQQQNAHAFWAQWTAESAGVCSTPGCDNEAPHDGMTCLPCAMGQREVEYWGRYHSILETGC